MSKLLDYTGLSYFKSKLAALFATKAELSNKFVALTEEAYEALTVKDPDTIYMTYEDE